MCTPTDFKTTEYRKVRVDGRKFSVREFERWRLDEWCPEFDAELKRFYECHRAMQHPDPIYIFTLARPRKQ